MRTYHQLYSGIIDGIPQYYSLHLSAANNTYFTLVQRIPLQCSAFHLSSAYFILVKSISPQAYFTIVQSISPQCSAFHLRAEYFILVQAGTFGCTSVPGKYRRITQDITEMQGFPTKKLFRHFRSRLHRMQIVFIDAYSITMPAVYRFLQYTVAYSIPRPTQYNVTYCLPRPTVYRGLQYTVAYSMPRPTHYTAAYCIPRPTINRSLQALQYTSACSILWPTVYRGLQYTAACSIPWPAENSNRGIAVSA